MPFEKKDFGSKRGTQKRKFGSSRGTQKREFGFKKEMHKAICADCGQECEVPFEPKEGRPVYCRECFQKHRPKRF